MTASILRLARPDILALQPYRHAAWDPSLERLPANDLLLYTSPGPRDPTRLRMPTSA